MSARLLPPPRVPFAVTTPTESRDAGTRAATCPAQTPSTSACSRAAFSLLELLASMALLTVVLMITSVVLTQATRLSSINSGRARLVNEGRAALDLMAADLQQSIVVSNWASNVTFVVTQNDPAAEHNPYGSPAGALAFYRFHPPNSKDRERQPRDLQQILYAVKQNVADGETPTGTFSLRRTVQPVNDLRAIPEDWITPLWDEADAILLDNVAGFLIATSSHPDSKQIYEQLPAYVDLYLEVLTPEDAIRTSSLHTTDERLSYIERRVIRLSRRVALPHRYGFNLP